MRPGVLGELARGPRDGPRDRRDDRVVHDIDELRAPHRVDEVRRPELTGTRPQGRVRGGDLSQSVHHVLHVASIDRSAQ